MSFLNTPRSGRVRNVIFEENGEWFGVALEFNIVETGDSPQEVMMLLDEAIKGYVESARKSKFSIKVLNQEIDPEYESFWDSKTAQQRDGKKVYSQSSQPLEAFA